MSCYKSSGLTMETGAHFSQAAEGQITLDTGSHITAGAGLGQRRTGHKMKMFEGEGAVINQSRGSVRIEGGSVIQLGVGSSLVIGFNLCNSPAEIALPSQTRT